MDAKLNTRLSYQTPDSHDDTIKTILRFAEYLTARGYVSNTLGNICVRVKHSDYEDGVCYTKHRGVSLEEMTEANIVVTDVPVGTNLQGKFDPSIGHQLNRRAFMLRDDINSVIHVHANSVIAYFSATQATSLKYLSEDTALIIEGDVHVLEPGANVELVPNLMDQFIHETNVFVMPHHGITALGKTLSQAYHRLNSVIAEVDRLIQACTISNLSDLPLTYRSTEEVKEMFLDGARVVYGTSQPDDFV